MVLLCSLELSVSIIVVVQNFLFEDFKAIDSRFMPHPSQRLLLNLPNTLTSTGIDTSDFFKRKSLFQSDMVHRAVPS